MRIKSRKLVHSPTPLGWISGTWIADDNVLVVFKIDPDEDPPLVLQTKWALTNGGQLEGKHSPLHWPTIPIVWTGNISKV